MKLRFWKKIDKQEVEKVFNPNEIATSDFQMMLKFGKASEIIGKWKSRPFIELPYGIVKKDLPNYQKQGLVLETIELILNFQFNDFKIGKASGNEIACFLLWIKDQQEFIRNIELHNLQSEPDTEMLAAGVNRLNEFGELSTIDGLANGNILNYKKIESLPYFEVYQKLKLDKTLRDINKNYEKIMTEKSKRR